MSIIIGTFTPGSKKGPITTDTPIYQWDDTTDVGTTYMRWENTTDSQYMQRIENNIVEATYDTWANRSTTVKWRPVNGA